MQTVNTVLISASNMNFPRYYATLRYWLLLDNTLPCCRVVNNPRDLCIIFPWAGTAPDHFFFFSPGEVPEWNTSFSLPSPSGYISLRWMWMKFSFALKRDKNTSAAIQRAISGIWYIYLIYTRFERIRANVDKKLYRIRWSINFGTVFLGLVVF